MWEEGNYQKEYALTLQVSQRVRQERAFFLQVEVNKARKKQVWGSGMSGQKQHDQTIDLTKTLDQALDSSKLCSQPRLMRVADFAQRFHLLPTQRD